MRSMPVLLAISSFFLAVSSLTAEEAATKPFRGKPHMIPGKIETEDYDEGKPGEAYYDVEEKNLGVDYRGATQVDIEKRDDASGGHGIGWTKAGEWVAYTVVVKETGNYDVKFVLSAPSEGGKIHLDFNGKDATGPIAVPNTGSFQKLGMVVKQKVPLKAGKYVMKMVMDANGKSGYVSDIDSIEFTRSSE
ncbi:MAG: carbohydrate-binding protein [Proteobacteria bacterium]|nr:carbohydrate-binding protein [Pseudomonadota bacterium]